MNTTLDILRLKRKKWAICINKPGYIPGSIFIYMFRQKRDLDQLENDEKERNLLKHAYIILYNIINHLIRAGGWNEI